MSNIIPVRLYVESLAAIHLSSYVESKFLERGGLMVVGPPEVLKSTLLELLDRHYADVLTLSDINAKSLVSLRDSVASGRVRSLVFPEWGKIYERKDDTARNVEGVIRAMVAEGFSAASFEESRIQRLQARATVFGAMTPATQGRNAEAWESSGFTRRFLWSLIGLADPTVIERAIVRWERLPLGLLTLPRMPVDGTLIPNLTRTEERQELRLLLKYQPGGGIAVQLQVMVKMLSVLRWWYQQSGDVRNPMDTVRVFARSLGRHGGLLEFDSTVKMSPQRMGAERARVEKSERTAAARRLGTPKRKRR